MTCVHVCVTHDRTVLVHPPQWIVCRIFVDSSLRIGSIVRDVKTPCGQNAEAKIVHTSTRESSTSVVALQITQTLCHGHCSSHTHTQSSATSTCFYGLSKFEHFAPSSFTAQYLWYIFVWIYFGCFVLWSQSNGGDACDLRCSKSSFLLTPPSAITPIHAPKR